jgi:hypothetical protein
MIRIFLFLALVCGTTLIATPTQPQWKIVRD